MSAALEDVKTIDIETWGTLNTASSPTKLDKGQTPDMKNVWVDEKPGSVVTANGYIKVGTAPSGNPCSFCINFFKTSSGTQTFVLSDNATVWATVDFQNFTTIITGLSSLFQLRGKVIRDKLWLTNGSDAVRTFDGSIVVILDGSGGTPNVPRGRFIDYYDERVWLYHISGNRSQASFSALTDNAGTIITPDNVSAWPSSNNLQISEGDADFGTGMILYRGNLHFFKQYSIWRLAGYDEYTYTRIKTRASTGTRFNESLGILDSLVHLIGIDGLYVFDGEETQRISDLIDPGTASQSAFGFNQLQQPNQNNQFWETSDTADWNSGGVPGNLLVNNQAALIAADDAQSDFQAGVTQTRVDVATDPGILQLSHTNAGASNLDILLNQPVTIELQSAVNTIGNPAWLTDGDLTNSFGFSGANSGFATVPFTHSLPVTTIVLRGLIPGLSSGGIRFFDANNTILIPLSVTAPGILNIDNVQFPSSASPQDFTVTFAVFTTTSIRLQMTSSSGMVMSELQVFATAYNTTGKFTSKPLNLVIAPASLGTFNVDGDLNLEGWSFFTQTSDDGVVWDPEVAVLPGPGGLIASTPRQYLRWGTNLSSDGVATPQIRAAYLPTVYLSAVHNTGGSIFAWGPFEADYSLASQTINFYYRSAPSLGGINTATWKMIVPGGVVSDSTANQYIQFKIEISGGDITHLPVVRSVTINWIVGSGIQAPTLQNVGSTVWRNRYWLSAASSGSTMNNTILIRGKKTFGSPFQLKDWPILSFCRYQDNLYGCSSVDGSIYRLDTGYSKDGSAMDAYFETGDILANGFTMQLMETLIEVERTGPYSLSVGYSIDRGNTFSEYPVSLTPSTFAPSYVKKINFGVTTDRIRFRVRMNAVDQPFQVHRLVAFYQLDASRGSIR